MKQLNLLSTTSGRLFAFFCLYVTEGLPLGFTATALATQMRHQGVGPKDISIFVGTLYLPWAWKWAIGPVVDLFSSERFGWRRTWIVMMQILMAFSLLSTIAVDFTTQMTLLTFIIIIHNIFGATQDVAIDALACGTLKEKERGLANGLMFAGAYIGQAIGGAGVLFLIDLIPYAGKQTGNLTVIIATHLDPFKFTFFFVAGCILSVTSLMVFFVSEGHRKKTAARHEKKMRAIATELKTYILQAFRAFFGSKAAVAGMIFALLPAGAYSLSLALQSNLAVELGMTNFEISQLALISTVLSAAGCVIGGFLSDRFDRRNMLARYLIGTALPTLFLGIVMVQYDWIISIDVNMPNRPVPPAELLKWFWIACIVFSLLQGLMYGTRTALFMDICTPAVAATQFTAYMSLLNLVIWYSATWQGFSIENLGYPATLFLDALLGLLAFFVLPFIIPRKQK